MEWKDLIFQAEDGKCEGLVKCASERAGYSGKGYVTGFFKGESNNWQMKVQIPKAGHYTLTVRTAADQYKLNYLTVNGRTAGTIETMGTGAFEDAVIESVYLEEGENVLAINKCWGEIDLDSIEVSEGHPVSDNFYQVSGELSNPNVDEKTKEVMAYLMSIYGKKTLAGQYTNHGFSTETDALYRLTGKYPAIRGFDFIFYSPNSGGPEGKDTDLAIEWDKKGGLVTFAWHWCQPIGRKRVLYRKNGF